jgi:outer membrane scaffolding protein for murein synthesis (MipA/OmpV family)
VYQEKRSQSGNRVSIIDPNADVSPLQPGHVRFSGKLDEVPARWMLGGFYHYHAGGPWRLGRSFLYGAGPARNAARLTPELRYNLQFPHATLSLHAGLVWANQAWNQAYFGVPAGSVSGLPVYTAQSGVKDVHLGLNWNWALSSSWLLTNSVKLTHLQGSAANSPLVQRRTSAAFSSALAWRF